MSNENRKLSNEEYSAIYNKLYAISSYGGKKKNIYRTRPRMLRLYECLEKNNISKKEPMLIVSCGRGRALKLLLKDGYTVEATEICDFLIENDLKDVTVYKLYCSELDKLGPNRYNVVFCCDVLEHLSTEEEAEQAINSIANISSRYAFISVAAGKAK